MTCCQCSDLLTCDRGPSRSGLTGRLRSGPGGRGPPSSHAPTVPPRFPGRLLLERRSRHQWIGSNRSGDRGPAPAPSMCGSGRVFKLLLALLGPLLSVSAVMPFLGAVYFLLTNRTYRHFIGNDYLLLPASLSFAVGGLLVLTGIIGLCVAVNRSQCQQGTVESADLDSFDEIFGKYNESTPESGAVDRLQQQMQCCGVKNYTDWTRVPWFIHRGNASVPHSCCARNFTTCTGDLDEPGLLYTEGCLLTLRDELQWNFLFTLSWVILVCCLQSLGVLIIHLLPNCNSAQYQLLNTDNFS
ncbi:tetraspanin-36-like isoform X2 [Heptranchias perlo]|uniref:tetraspanin-36-like isoform X2 n=1 Tax=Heptranchias perlo TaxID=212740 RepID=UPI00355AC1AE